MVGLLDIAPQAATVQIGESSVDVYGISVAGIAILLKRYPALAKLAEGKGASVMDELRQLAPEAIAAIIAIGCGFEENSAAEKFASRLSVETQLDLLTAIGRLTFPSGVSPFVKKITAISEAVSDDIGKAQDTKLRRQSKASLPADTPPKESGL